MERKISTRKISIRTRLLITIVLSCFMPIILIYVITMRLVSVSLEKSVSDSVEQTLSLINTNMMTELEKYQYLCGAVSLNEQIRESLNNKELTQGEKHILRQQISDTILSQIIYPGQTKNISVYDVEGNLFYSTGYDGFFDEDRKMLLEAADQNTRTDSWNYVRTYRGRDTIVLGRKIFPDYTSGIGMGYVFVSIDEKVFSRTVLAPVELEKGNNIVYTNEDGTVLSSWDEEVKLGEHYESTKFMERIREGTAGETGSFRSEQDGAQVLVTYIFDEDLGQYFISTIPVSSLNAQINRLWVRVGLVLTFILVLIVLGLQGIYRSIAVPIRNMVRFCERVAEGDFNARIGDQAKDELATLSVSMDHMAEDIDRLMKTQYETQQEKRKIELQMLQYQISPHFLFNTLNSLQFVAAMNQDQVVSNGIHALSLLLQNTISNTQEHVPIREEIENLKNYFSIQSIRYAGEFEVHYEVDEGLHEYECPKFILQPLAENAIIHGAACDPAITNITIRVYEEEEQIVFTIFDDGAGFAMEKEGLPEPSGMGIGLENVNSRIKLYFGEGYGLEIKSTPEEGTMNRIRIPKIKTR